MITRGSAAPDTPQEARVVVCDDEGRLAQLTAGLLRHHGFVAEAVGEGGKVLELAAAEPGFQVLLLDLNLEGMSSQQVVAELGARNPDIRIVVTSGVAPEDLPEDLMNKPNVAGYLPKPYPVERLVEVVREAMRR